MLAAAFPFAPEVFAEETGVEIWLPELEVYGQGSTLAEAQDDLVDAALDFVDAWETELRAAPNQRHKSGHARRVQLAGDRARVAEALFGATPDGSPRREPPAPAICAAFASSTAGHASPTPLAAASPGTSSGPGGWQTGAPCTRRSRKGATSTARLCSRVSSGRGST